MSGSRRPLDQWRLSWWTVTLHERGERPERPERRTTTVVEVFTGPDAEQRCIATRRRLCRGLWVPADASEWGVDEPVHVTP